MNLGGYDKNDFNESTGNVILARLLHSNSDMYTHFSSLDKIPNFDGYFEILAENKTKKVPCGRIEVQIKTLDHDYTNDNKRDNISKYKYSCDTKIFNAVISGITLNPAFLFMVDVQNNRVFWKYISLKYALSLKIQDEKNKTIYFNDEDEITDVKSFYGTTKQIYDKQKQSLLNEEEHNFLTTDNLTTDELTMLQDEFDYLNNVFSSELSFIKKRLYPDVWKFGIAYLKDEESVGIGIYFICKGKQGEYFKVLDKESHKTCLYIYINRKETMNLHELVNQYIKSVLKRAFDKHIYPIELVSDEILSEVSFYFLDKIATIDDSLANPQKPWIYMKDVESVEVLANYFSAIKQFAFERLKFPIQVSKNMDAIYLVDPLEDFKHGKEKQVKKERLQYLLKNPNEREKITVNMLMKGEFDYSLLEETVVELRKRNIREINRVWIPKDWTEFEKRIKSKGLYRIENGYTIKDYYENIKILISKIPDNYNQLIEKNPFIKSELVFKRKYVYGLVGDESFGIHSIIYDSNELIMYIDNSILQMSESEKEKLFEDKNVKYIRKFSQAHIFDVKFPLLISVCHILFNQLAQKYGITNLELEKNKNIIL